MVTRLCVGRPCDWWDLGDDGNRLALAFCYVCPSRTRCSAGDPRPHGVIRAGVAYSDAGNPLAICACGYPDTSYRDGRIGAGCPRCAVPPLDVVRPAVEQRARVGDSNAALGRRFGADRTTVREALKRWGFERPTHLPERTAA
mgnify:CR=1 FL=1